MREDVYREADFEDEVVSVSKTRDMRKLWGNMESVEEDAEKAKRNRRPQVWHFIF